MASKTKKRKHRKAPPRVRELVAKCETNETMDRIARIFNEFVSGFHFLNENATGQEVTFFGSARTDPKNAFYKDATKLAKMLSEDGYGVITGGGPGIMEAANRGAHQAKGKSIGLNIQLSTEQRINKYVKQSIAFNYFFSRKVMLAFSSEVYVYYPGGFGTLDEFFEIVTLVQTKKTHPVPIILVGKAYWGPLLEWVEQTVYKEFQSIGKKDMNLFHLVDSAEEAFPLIRKLVK
jgi:uncharacterized protein (TIGR00730 family)